MEKVGNVPTTLTCAAKGRYANVDLARWGQRYGITFNPSDMRGNDGDACSRAVLASGAPTEAAAITLALYRACWTEGKALATIDDILAVIAAAGKIGRASCRERVCQYVSISEGAVSLKKK